MGLAVTGFPFRAYLVGGDWNHGILIFHILEIFGNNHPN